MASKQIKINEDFTFRYNSREEESGDTVLDLDINFSNPKDDSNIVDRLNRYLVAIGHDNIVVSLKKGS